MGDIGELGPYRNARTVAMGGRSIGALSPSSIPGLDIGEMQRATPRPTNRIPAGGARATLESLRASGQMAGGAQPAAAAPVASPTATAARAGGVLDADIGAVARNAANSARTAGTGALRSITSGVGRVALPLAIGAQAAQTAGTDTGDYYARTGIAPPNSDGVGSLAKDIGVRALGTAQDIGNNLTFGIADRVGNLIAGNGFNRSTGPGYDQPQGIAAPPAKPAAPQPVAAPNIGQPIANIMPPQPSDLVPTDSSVPQPALGAPTGLKVADGQTATNADVQKAAQALDAFGPGAHNADGTGGSSGFRASATEERNARLRRQNQLAALDSAARLATSPRERAAAIGAYAQLAGGQDQNTTQADIARLKEGGETTRAIASGKNRLSIASSQNQVTSRGQDIGLLAHQLGSASSLDIAKLHSGDARYSADKGADARVLASENRQPRYMHVAGGSRVEMVNGLPITVRDPDTVIDTLTGQPVRPATPVPSVGQTITRPDGSQYKFLGGDPAQRASWTKL